MLDFMSECVVLASKAWIGSVIIATISIAVMVFGAVIMGVIKVTLDKDDD